MAAEVWGQEAEKVADLLARLGNVPARRVLLNPSPGRATEKDLLRMMRKTGRLYELVDGTLVEKPMGAKEGLLAGRIIRLMGVYLEEHDIGEAGSADTLLRIMTGLVRVPDVAFIRWENLPGGHFPDEPIPDLYPDLAVEVLSKSNTRGEMKRKLKEYFLAGTTLVWIVDPRRRTVTVHTAPDASTIATEADTLDGGTVMPGFKLPVQRLFARLAPSSRKRTRAPRKP